MLAPLSPTVAVRPEKAALWSRRTLTYWALQFLIWGTYFWSQASGEAIFASVPWRKAETLWGVVTVASVLITNAIRILSKRRAWLARRPPEMLWRVAIATLLGSLVAYEVMVATSQWLYGTPVAPIFGEFYRKLPLGNQLFNQFVGILLVYTAWVSGYLAVVTQRQRRREEVRQAQLSEALQAAELRLLKSQLNPHFLFNALNGVRALIADEPSKAQDAVTQLARTLRYTLASGDAELVTLSREMEMVDDYLALESLRLAERLTIVRNIEPAAANALIPAMLLQTLVENGIKHGVAPLKQGGTLRISARISGETLMMEVENPRPVGAGVVPAFPGIGLKNSSERLRLLFGSAANLDLDLSNAHRALATVRLPCPSALGLRARPLSGLASPRT